MVGFLVLNCPRVDMAAVRDDSGVERDVVTSAKI
jgi:hypothetical protein